MTWMSTLYKTYEKALQLDLSNEEHQLLPISHTIQNAHIKIVIDENGNFKRAMVLDKIQIVLPATESSAGRSSGEAPHPLADKLQYVAKDYPKYGGTKKGYFDGYEKQLRNWCESSFSHARARAVYGYIRKGHVIEDLIKSKIIHVNDQNVLLTKWSGSEEEPKLFKILPKKDGKIEQGDAMVCWSVEIAGDKFDPDTWNDRSLQQSWIDYLASQETEKGFCYITGDNISLATNHPAKLRHTGDKAKLISSNDKSGFTFRGKFNEENEACSVSFEVTQKAHNVLRWLMSRQGSRNGDQVIVAWAISGNRFPRILLSTADLFNEIDDITETERSDEEDEVITSIDHGRNLGQQFAERLKKKLKGYIADLKDLDDTIVVMAIDSATPGRMAITYYRESHYKEFFERLESWHNDFAWPLRFIEKAESSKSKKNETKIIWRTSSPSPKSIAEAAYGQTLKDNLRTKTIERLLSCIIDKEPIPKDLVEACIRNASNPNAYGKDRWLWRTNVSIACALYKGYCSDRNSNINERRKYQMALERDYNGRDYLYGRLLALAEKIERYALDLSSEKRITNAERLMQRFSFRPFTTWKIIHESLGPYKDRLRGSENARLLKYWEREIADTLDLFDHVTFSRDLPLSGEYLLGYYCQKNYKKPKDTDGKTDLSINEINQEGN